MKRLHTTDAVKCATAIRYSGCCKFSTGNNRQTDWNDITSCKHAAWKKYIGGALCFVVLFDYEIHLWKNGFVYIIPHLVHNIYLWDYPFRDLLTESPEGQKTQPLHFDPDRKMAASQKMSSLLSLTHLFALIFGMLRGSEMICCCRSKLIQNLFFFFYATGY